MQSPDSATTRLDDYIVSMLPWALPAQTGFISFHWMMIYWGFLNSALETLFGVYGPDWLSHYWLALGANIVAYNWKTMPFWTLILLAGRIARQPGTS